MADIRPYPHRVLVANNTKLDFLRTLATGGIVATEGGEEVKAGSEGCFAIEECGTGLPAQLTLELQSTSIHWLLHVVVNTTDGHIRVGFSENPLDADFGEAVDDLVDKVTALDWDDFEHPLALTVISEDGELYVTVNEEAESGGWCNIL